MGFIDAFLKQTSTSLPGEQKMECSIVFESYRALIDMDCFYRKIHALHFCGIIIENKVSGKYWFSLCFFE